MASNGLQVEPVNSVIRETAYTLFGPDHSPKLYRSALARQGLPQPGARQRPGLLRQVPRADAAGQAGQPGDGADGRQGRDGDQGIVQL